MEVEEDCSPESIRGAYAQQVVYQDNLVLFWGFGIPLIILATCHLDPSQDTRSTDGRGWTNELHMVHPKEGIHSSWIVSCTVRGRVVAST